MCKWTRAVQILIVRGSAVSIQGETQHGGWTSVRARVLRMSELNTETRWRFSLDPFPVSFPCTDSGLPLSPGIPAAHPLPSLPRRWSRAPGVTAEWSRETPVEKELCVLVPCALALQGSWLYASPHEVGGTRVLTDVAA